MRFQEFAEARERERKELTARLAGVERLVEQQQQVINCLQSLAPLRDPGRIDWERGGEPNPLSPCRTLLTFWVHVVLCFFV